MVGGAREKPRAGGARFNPRVQPGWKPTVAGGGRSHSGDFLEAAMAATDDARADYGGAPGADGEPMKPGDSEGFEGRKVAAVMTP